jgi:hypothetical protein
VEHDDANLGDMINLFWEEFDFFHNKAGPFENREHIRVSGDVRSGASHIWHSKNSLRYTKVFGQLACRVCSKILGIGSAERAWGDVKHLKTNKKATFLTNDMIQSYVCDDVFKCMKLSLEQGDVEKFDEKWSKMFSIRQAYWKHPRGSKFARRYGFPKEGYEAMVKKRFKKKPMYTQDDMDLRLLAPFDDGPIVEGEVVEELIFVNFITGLELGIQMPSLTYLHESAKQPTMGQTYVEEDKELRFRMNWGRHLTPWPNHLSKWNRTEEHQKRISVHYYTYTQYHPGYLTIKENLVEDSVETGIKSPEPKGTKRRRESESHTVAMVITTPPPKWAGHCKER